MVRTAKLQNIEVIENIAPLEESDNEIELKPLKHKKIVEQLFTAPLVEDIPKARRKLNLTDEERDRRRNSMIETRAKRAALVEHKKLLEMEYLRQQEEATQQKIMKKAEQLKKKKEKELYNKYLEDINNKPKPKQKMKQPKVIYESETENDDSEDEIVIVKKKKGLKGGSLPPVASPAVEHNQTPQQPQRPMFRIAY